MILQRQEMVEAICISREDPILPKRSDVGVMVSRICWCFWEVRGYRGSNPSLSAT